MNQLHNKDKNPINNKNNETIRSLVFFSQISFTMVASVLLGVFLGKFIDRLLGTAPWMLLVFSLLGVGAAFKSVFDMSKSKKNQ